MRKFAFVIVLTLALLLSGCEKYREVENHAYVIMLGVDLAEDDQIQISALIPKIAEDSGSESGESSNSNHQVYAAAGANFDAALNRLHWVVPRQVDLSQVKVIMLSERLARSGLFMPVAYAMMETYHLYTAARLVICEGKAQTFIESENETLGTRIATDLDAMFEDYTSQALIPDGQFADVFYMSASIYSDPIAIYSPSSETAAASVIMPQSADQPGDTQPQKNRFLGACVFRNGTMRGVLTAEDTLYCKLLRGKSQSFQMESDLETLYLAMSTAPSIRVDSQSDPVRISVDMCLSLQTKSECANTNQIAQMLRERILATIDRCKRMGVEPFRFADVAAGGFATIGEWLDYDWHSHFSDSEVDLRIQIIDEAA